MGFETASGERFSFNLFVWDPASEPVKKSRERRDRKERRAGFA
jgi:hypothetical protein